jgi:hypothetical protein
VSGSVRMGFVVDKLAVGQVFLRVLSRSEPFHRGYPLIYIIWGIKKKTGW